MKLYYIIAVALVLGVTTTAQLETRRFVWNGRAITSELRPDDRHVEIETSNLPPGRGQPSTGMSQVEAAVTGKDTGFGVSPGSRLQFRQAGGRARIQGALVDAVVPWRMPLLTGKIYLIFGIRHEGQYLHIGAYEVDEARRLRKMTSKTIRPRTRGGIDSPEPEPIDELEAFGADAIFVWLEDEVRRQQAIQNGTTTPR